MWTAWPVFIYLYHIVHSENDIPPCKNEKACNHAFMCQNNVCKECIKCGLLFRKGSDCESNFNDCGPCLPGYKEISTTSSSNVVKPCRPEKIKSDTCNNDEDCPVGTYCHEKFCAVCFNCTLLNKLPPSNGCAKNLNKCGFCADGFYELPVTTNSDIKLCERNVLESHNFSKEVLSVSNVLPFCVLLTFIVLVIKLTIRKHKAKSDTKVISCERPLSPSAPPLFAIDIPDNTCEEKNEKCSTVKLATESIQQANTARIFKHPHALYYFAEESAGGASDHSNDSNEEGSSPPQRSGEAEEACSLSIFIHRYLEIPDHISSSQEVNESIRSDRQYNVCEDTVDSETHSEDAVDTFPRTDDSNPPS